MLKLGNSLRLLVSVSIFLAVAIISCQQGIAATKTSVQFEWRAPVAFEIPESEDFDSNSTISSEWVKDSLSEKCSEDFQISQFRLQGASGKYLASSVKGSNKDLFQLKSASWIEDEFGELNYQIQATCIGRLTLSLATKSNFYRVEFKSDAENAWLSGAITSRWFSHSELVASKWKLETLLTANSNFDGELQASNWTPRAIQLTPSVILQSSKISNGENWTEKGSVNAVYMIINPEFSAANIKYFKHFSLQWKTRDSDPDWMYESYENTLEINLSPTYGDSNQGRKLIRLTISRNDEDFDPDIYEMYVDLSGAILSFTKKT
jgi:hypothetical protein